jgi:hypothetical protein
MRSELRQPWIIRVVVQLLAGAICAIFLHTVALAFVIASVAGLVAIQMRYGKLYRKR